VRTKRCRRRNGRCRGASNGRNVCAPGHVGGVCVRAAYTHKRTQEWNDAWAYLSTKHLFYAIKNDDNLYELDLRKVVRIYNDQSGVSSTSIGDAPDNTPSTPLVLVERGTSLCMRSASVLVERQWRAAISYELKVDGGVCTRPHRVVAAAVHASARTTSQRRQRAVRRVELYTLHKSAWHECRRNLPTQWLGKKRAVSDAALSRR
jgi:hypothetical protein